MNVPAAIGHLAMKWSMTPQGQWIRIPFIRFPDGSDKPLDTKELRK